VSWTQGTDPRDFARAVARSLPSLDCIQALRFARCPAFAVVGGKDALEGLTRLRLRLDGALGSELSATVIYDHELHTFQSERLAGDLAEDLTGGSFLGAEGTLVQADHLRWSHRLYRGFLHYTGRHLEARLGRQRIAWGVGRLWNPIDRFNAIPPLSIEPDQSRGVDALDLRWLIDDFDTLQAIYAPGSSRQRARYALRLHGLAHDLDYSLVAGVFERAVTLGANLAGNLGDAAFGFELVWTDPHRDIWPIGERSPEGLDAYWQAVAFVNTNLPVGSGLTFLVEHLYNGNALGFGKGRAGPLLELFSSTEDPPPGVPAALGPFPAGTDSARFGGSRVISFARNQTGVQLGYDLTAALRGNLVAIYDWNGHSAAFFPVLSYTGWNALEITAGVQLFVGPRHSQYGSAQPLAFVLAEVFF